MAEHKSNKQYFEMALSKSLTKFILHIIEFVRSELATSSAGHTARNEYARSQVEI